MGCIRHFSLTLSRVPHLVSLHYSWYMYYARCSDDRGLTATKNPTGLFPHGGGQRAGARVAERIAGSRAPRHRERPVAGAVAVAGGDAAVPGVGKRTVGNPYRPADEAH